MFHDWVDDENARKLVLLYMEMKVDLYLDLRSLAVIPDVLICKDL